MLVVTHKTIRNPGILDVRQLPRRFFGRAAVWPRGVGLLWHLRLLVEFDILRYAVTLAPLVVIGVTWTETALPLAQAPVLMVLIVWVVEARLLRLSPRQRETLIDPAEAERGLDLLGQQARGVLTRIAAGRKLTSGTLYLVVEQSDLARIVPLTYVTVQSDDGPRVLDLSVEERRLLDEGLFQPPLDERQLQRINQAQNEFLRSIPLEARSLSAHSRLAAALA